ncbi:MAG TPA: dTDP-4-dehydrorhamnose reductase [Terracidiphilus sp.]|jgi:dTDP-4-dehydrorhamnose reductase
MPSEQRILLTGVNGQVGGDLLPMLQQLGTVIAPTRSELDLADAEGIRRFVHNLRPHWIVNPAAYTAVDKAESEAELAYAINADAPQAFGKAAAELGIPVIHFSTDYVFNGEGTTPWIETDATAPLGVYGASKLAGEQALAASGAAHLIFRTSWVYSSRGKNFLLAILRLAQQKDELRIVDDQHGAPTWSRDLATMVANVVRTKSAANQGASTESAVRAVEGVYHAAASGETTWFGFAQEFLLQAAVARPEAKFARLIPIASREYPTPARRPANSRLNCQRLQRVFNVSMPAWQKSAAAAVGEALLT